jgi:hypothetical protein
MSNFLSKFVYFILCIMVIGFVSPAIPVAAESVHPRLYYTQPDLVALQTLRTVPSHQTIWNGIRSWADSNTNDAAPTSIGSDTWKTAETVRQYLENMGFVYSMTTTASYADSAKRWALVVAGWNNWGGYMTTSIITMGMSFTYDTLYNYLTVDERTTIRTAIINRMSPHYDTYFGHIESFSEYPNGGCYFAGALGIAGLALEGDYAGAANWINFATTLTQTLLGWGGSDGGWFEGLNYATSFEYPISFLDALKRIKGQNLFTSDFLNQLPHYYIYGTYNNKLLPLEDTEWNSITIRKCTFIYRLASEYEDGHAQWFANQSAAALLDSMSYFDFSAIRMYIWKNTNVTALTPNDLPLTRYFSSIGYVISRTGWTSNDYVFVFKSGTSQGHAHPDQNSWSLFGPISDGVISGNPGYVANSSYDRTSIANCILGNGLGQAQEPGDYDSAPLGTRGVVQQVDIKSSYTYVRGDAHAPYINKSSSDPLLASADLTKWLRNIVVMKDPFYFVIYDDVAAPRVEQIDWLFQGNGGTFTTNGNVITLNRGTTLNALVLEPSAFTAQLVNDTTITKNPQMRLHPTTTTANAKFVTVLFPNTISTTARIKQGNLIGAMISTDATHLDLQLFSTDGQPVNQWIELGGRYTAADGQTYNYNGTQIQANFSNYQVIRLLKNSGPVINTSVLIDGEVPVAYSQALTASGGTTPYAWSMTTGSLPPGLSLNTATGAISGTPTTTGNYSFTVKVTDDGGTIAIKSLSITVNGGLTITTTSLGGFDVGISYDRNLIASGGAPPYTWSITAGSLPTGLSLNSTTGGISGTPTMASGLTSVTLMVTDSTGSTATMSFSITVKPALSFTTVSLTNGKVTVAYSQSLAASGGIAPYTWSITTGSLPPGLSLNTATGAISGTPTTAGTYSFTVKVIDTTGGSITRSLSITVNAITVNGGLTITTTSLGGFDVGISYDRNLIASGGAPPYTWSITAGSLPTGLSLNSATGIFSGTPTAVSGPTSITFTVTDSNGGTASKSFSITVKPALSFTTVSLTNGKVAVAYSQSLAASGGWPTYVWSITTGSLPPGLSLNTATGVISGTPTTAGTYRFTIKLVDRAGGLLIKSLSITVK